MDSILIFDTETSGLPPFQMVQKKRTIASPIKYLTYWDECRIVELAWQIYQPDGTLIKSYSSLVYPDGFQISPESTKIHGITQEEAITHGKSIQTILQDFQKDLQTVSTIVAHNIDFDYSVVLSEYLRQSLSIDSLKTKKQLCTMKDWLQADRKWPKLTELYYECFEEELQQTHRALDDVDACAKIFFHLQGK